MVEGIFAIEGGDFMSRIASVAFLLTILILLLGCNDNADSNEMSSDSTHDSGIELEIDAEFAQLAGSNFIFQVDRSVMHPNKQSPDARIEESEYKPNDEIIEYAVEFSENTQSVLINPGELSGTLESEKNDMKQFSIESGFFAGGIFLVWIEEGVIQAELTEYGSGVPIIKSERGNLVASD
ncbi:MAG: hypothetical protein GY943_09165 [Chloroflexi bacterium]|nr:hypothetical protein [Chloroflexota bacterium]